MEMPGRSKNQWKADRVGTASVYDTAVAASQPMEGPVTLEAGERKQGLNAARVRK